MPVFSPRLLETAWPTTLLPDLPLGRPIPASTASRESYVWARNKLRRCQALHKSCRKVRDDVLRRSSRAGGGPRRLLIVGQDPDDTVHLREVGDEDDDTETLLYAALSHCWGRSPFLQTRTANITQHRSPGGIPLAALPRTFREAVAATRLLGLGHLWVDSLCIVQDDARDWQAESARMAAVYQGAHVVLSASRAAGAHDGLFSDPAAGSDLYAPPHVETVAMPDGPCSGGDAAPPLGQVAFRRAYAHMPSPMQRQLHAEPAFPTLSRGWIYQERLLASRVLHFGPHELHWECMAESVCQCRDNDDDEEGEAPPAISTKPEFSREHWQSLDAHQRSVSWHRLVENYTALHLTFDTDIFPALSGVAKTFQSANQQSAAYLAGLWQDSLILDLLWHAQPPSSANDSVPVHLQPWQQRPLVYRAPSWSWAAVKGPVEYVNTHRGVDPFCSAVEAKVQRAGSDETGELAAGHLVLRGYALSTPASFRPPPDGQPDKYNAWNLLQLDVLQAHVANVWVDYNYHLRDDLPPTVLCFLLGECIPSGALMMLLLKPVATGDDDKENRVYQRIGIVQVSKPPSGQSSLDYWRQVFPSKQLVIKIV